MSNNDESTNLERTTVDLDTGELYSHYTMFYDCPNCLTSGDIMNCWNFCPNCGVALDWPIEARTSEADNG